MYGLLEVTAELLLCRVLLEWYPGKHVETCRSQEEQELHTDAPAVEYEPAGQTVHEDAPEDEKRPDGHKEQLP